MEMGTVSDAVAGVRIAALHLPRRFVCGVEAIENGAIRTVPWVAPEFGAANGQRAKHTGVWGVWCADGSGLPTMPPNPSSDHACRRVSVPDG